MVVDITIQNIKGLYTGVIAQIASSLTFAANDNFRSEGIMREALDIMQKILDENPEGLNEATTEKLYGMMEDQSHWDDSSQKASGTQEPSAIKLNNRFSVYINPDKN